MKKTLAVILSVMTLLTSALFVAPTSIAASVSCDFTDVNGGGIKGFVDNLDQGNLEVVEIDGKKALKFTPNSECAGKDKLLALEGSGFSRLGADYKTFRYMSVEYKYVTNSPKSVTFDLNVCNSNKVFQTSVGQVSGSKLSAGDWAVAYFDLTIVDDRLRTDIEKHPINHIHLRPYGSSTKAGNIPAEDIFYIGKITFSEENLDPNGTTVAPAEREPEKQETTTASPAKTETPATLGDGGASPKYVGEKDVFIEFSRLSKSSVDNVDIGTIEHVEVSGRKLFKYTPNPTASGAANNVAFEAFNVSSILPSKLTYEEFDYISVEYYYDSANPTYTTNGGIYLANSNKVFTTGAAVVKSDEPLTANKWAVAVFPTYKEEVNLKSDMTEHIFNHFHLRLFNTKASALTSNDVLYVGKIGFHTENPNPKDEYTVTFRAAITGASGELAPFTVKANASFKLPENPYTIEGFEFLGWSNGIKTYSAGEEIVADGNVATDFAAVWKESSAELPAIQGFNYDNLFTEVVDKSSTLVAEKITIDGVGAVKAIAVPNPSDGKVSIMNLDAYSLRRKMKIDLHRYKYMTVIYKYEGNIPQEVVRPHLQFTRNSGMFSKGGPALVFVSEGKDVGGWKSATFEIPDQTGNWTDPNAEHTLTQFHIYPFGNVLKNNQMPENAICYVQGVAFSEDIPELCDFAPSYITGFDDGSFGISGSMTRAQACTIVARLICGSDAAVPNGDSAFTDVAADAWYTKYIAFCESKGLLKSYAGTFSPDKNITRAEFAELVYNMGIVKATDNVRTFKDVAENHPKYAVIAAAASAGLINGYPEGDGTFTFKPDNEINRAEVVKVINNAYGRKTSLADAEIHLGTFADVSPDHWAFSDIIDAAIPHATARASGDEFNLWLYGGSVDFEVGEDRFAEGEKMLAEIDALTDKRINEIRSTKTEVKILGTSYYFSNNGDDSNDGLSPESPKKNLDALKNITLKPGDGVFFKRGDTFRGAISGKKGVTYSAYGEGAKPVIMRSPANFAGAENWELTDVENVWKLKTPVLHDIGLVVFDEGKETQCWSEKRIKGRPDFKEGKLSDLNADLVMWHDVPNPTGAEGYLYVRSDKGNPGERFSSIEVAPRDPIFRAADDVIVDNLCLKFTGGHAVSSGTVNNLLVQNCEFGWIGGSWFRTDTLSRFGNAVEVYGSCDGFTVDNCYIYQVYDAGVTHQYSNGETTNILMKDVKYINNVITETSYPVEYFTHKAAPGYYHITRNFEISGNIIRNTGYGFGDQRPDKSAAASIKGWASHANEAENYTITNNIFDRSKYRIFDIGAGSNVWNPVLSGNTFIQYYGADFGNFSYYDAAYTGTIEGVIKKGIGDEDAKIYFLKERK